MLVFPADREFQASGFKRSLVFAKPTPLALAAVHSLPNFTARPGQKIREIGREYGTTTGRPRRCGWFDAVAVRYTARLGGVTSIALMMMDVLSHFDEINICVAYELDGQRLNRFPSRADELRNCKPIYETVRGWNVDVTQARSLDDLPDLAISYMKKIESLIGIPVDVISVGPDRAQTIFDESLEPTLS